ncbi:hypothetical protein L1049_028379 [Liquidambar formosana]|uniref:Polygalacturonase At1g80170 n=1 Tax=Liquidambar formosana TaxID=63359 RepID=A0AAP0WWY3_LIQFO
MAIFQPFCIVLILSSCVLAQSHGNVFNVLDHGAIGDQVTDDTKGFMDAWEATCRSSSASPTMHVPANKTFLLNPLNFRGPCSSANVNVEMNGKIIGLRDPSQWQCDRSGCDKWIHFKHVDGLFVHGSGTIDGQGEKWWHPSALAITDSNNVRISGLSFRNNPHVHVVLDSSTSVYISNLSIEAPGNSPNTDGINIRGCKNVFISNCRIKTGDDCISIVEGSSYLNINNITCGPGHGISIGSLGKSGSSATVEYVHVSDVVFSGATNGVRIKTWQGGSGHARHIIFERIRSRQSDNPIIIDQFYCPYQHCTTQASAVHVTNVTYSQIWGTSRRKTAVNFACSETVPCTDIFMDNININAAPHRRHPSKAMSSCQNAHGVARGKMVPDVPCLVRS